MRTSSCKAKGRRLQQQVRDALRALGATRGLVDGDINSTSMGVSGVDVLLSPAADRLFSLAIECKNVERLQVVPTFLEHYGKYEADSRLKILVHGKNKIAPMVTLRFTDFITLLEKGLPS